MRNNNVKLNISHPQDLKGVTATLQSGSYTLSGLRWRFSTHNIIALGLPVAWWRWSAMSTFSNYLYLLLNPLSAGTEFRRQRLTSKLTRTYRYKQFILA